MAEINTEGKGGKHKGSKKVSTRVDLTPMVDLAFLLITFFMLTTSMLKPQTMEISMPSKDKVDIKDQTKVNALKAITIILGKNDTVYYYFGTRSKDNIDPKVEVTTYASSGIRKILLMRNTEVMAKVSELKALKAKNKIKDEDYKKQLSEAKSLKTAPVVLIKASDDSSYKNLVDILDEMQICNIGRYAIVDVTTYDLDLIKKINI
ncbi:MAG: ExbD/TolR family protein [Bacteroidales bacterium]